MINKSTILRIKDFVSEIQNAIILFKITTINL
jgi:hypothetical protein